MRKLFFLIFLVVPSAAFAWDGLDTVNGDYVSIGQGNLVRAGESIEVYNNSKSEVHYSDVISVYDSGHSTVVETFNHSTGETQYLEMEKD